MALDVFNRINLEGNQDISTINNIEDYVTSLLTNFNNTISQMTIELKELEETIMPSVLYPNNLVQIIKERNDKLNIRYEYAHTLIPIAETKSLEFINELQQLLISYTSLLNSKATTNSILTRPRVTNILNNNNSSVNIEYINQVITPYLLPSPIPNTKLYVNRTGTGLIWA